MLDDGTTLFEAADLYDLEFERYLGDLPFYRRVCAEASGERILELGCGTGRLTLPLAADGYHLLAVDLEPAMLACLRARLAGGRRQLRGTVEVVRADMRRFRGPHGEYSAVLIPFNTLQHVDQAGLDLTLETARFHLTGAGLLAFDLYAPPSPGPVRADLDYCGAEQVPASDRSCSTLVEQRVRHHAGAHLLETSYRYRTLGPGGEERGRRELTLWQRQWSCAELEAALGRSGFAVVGRYGDLDLRPLDQRSPRILVVATPR